MNEIVLHHYPLSLFAEKIRRILAYKRLPWRSVEQPMMAPKPGLTPLTGGYRRIPVLQIGADVYCDSACIARRLEEIAPRPACLPAERAALAALVEDWADHRLVSQVLPSAVLALLPQLPLGILADRAAMSPGFGEAGLRRMAPHAFRQALLSLDRLDARLRERPYLLGDDFTLADAACFHPVWFLRRSPALFASAGERPALAAWLARIEGFGPGDAKPMGADEAMAIARAAEPRDDAGDGIPAEGLAPGDTVAIAADDYGPEESVGTLAGCTPERITIRRRDPALGAIAVHFPRAGYRVRRVA